MNTKDEFLDRPVQAGDIVLLTKPSLERITTIRWISEMNRYDGSKVTVTQEMINRKWGLLSNCFHWSDFYWDGDSGHFKILNPDYGKKSAKPQSRELIFSESFFSFLRSIASESKIARLIIACLQIQNDHYGELISHVLTGEEASYITYRNDGSISFLPKNKEQLLTSDGKWKQEGRQTGKPAKVMRKIFKPAALKLLKEADFEIFNNKYKSRFAIEGYNFEVLPASEIARIYDAEIEGGRTSDGCSLNGSCMNGEDDYFDIYTHCKDLQILCFWNKNSGELAGRALLWNATAMFWDEETDKWSEEKQIKFLDRFYVSQDAFYEAFIQYAQDNGLYRKQHHKSFDYKTGLITPDGEKVAARMFIKTETDYDYYPYIDTFCYGDDGIIRNWDIQDDSTNEHPLQNKYTYNNTSGTRDENPDVWDEIRREWIHENDSVEVTEGDFEGMITHRYYVVELEGEIWSARDSKIVKCFISSTYVLKKECYYAASTGRYYHKRELVYMGDKPEEKEEQKADVPDSIQPLPLNWYIKTTPEIDQILRNWRGGGYSSSMNEVVLLGGAIHSEGYFVNSVRSPEQLDKHEEITYAQFEKYVLNK